MKLFRTTWAAAVLLLVGVSWAEEPAIFSHKQHIEEGVGCRTCHNTEVRGLPALSKSTCDDCHDDGLPAFRLPAASGRLEIAFPHSRHVESAECQDCHQNASQETQAAGEPQLSYADCSSCHRAQGIEVAKTRCTACHRIDQKRVPPTGHGRSWLASHGEASAWRVFDRHGQDCSLCHSSDACDSCHRTRKPRSHNALWRTRTHGIHAGWDRESCKTCHNTSFCIWCHRTTKPRNHRSAWSTTHGRAARTRSSRHCNTCHSVGWCAACHAGSAK